MSTPWTLEPHDTPRADPPAPVFPPAFSRTRQMLHGPPLRTIKPDRYLLGADGSIMGK